MRTFYEVKPNSNLSPQPRERRMLKSPSQYNTVFLGDLEEGRTRNRSTFGERVFHTVGTVKDCTDPQAVRGVFVAKIGMENKEKEIPLHYVPKPTMIRQDKQNVRVAEKRSFELPRNHSTYLPANINPEAEQRRNKPVQLLSTSPSAARLVDKNKTSSINLQTTEYIQGLQNYIRYLERIVERQNSANAILQRKSIKQAEQLNHLHTEIEMLQGRLLKLEAQSRKGQQMVHEALSEQFISSGTVTSTNTLYQPKACEYVNPLLRYGVPPLNIALN